jgi:hypothetical protein
VSAIERQLWRKLTLKLGEAAAIYDPDPQFLKTLSFPRKQEAFSTPSSVWNGKIPCLIVYSDLLALCFVICFIPRA